MSFFFQYLLLIIFHQQSLLPQLRVYIFRELSLPAKLLACTSWFQTMKLGIQIFVSKSESGVH